MDRSSPPAVAAPRARQLPDPVPALCIGWGCLLGLLLVCAVGLPSLPARVCAGVLAFILSAAPTAVILWCSGALDREDR